MAKEYIPKVWENYKTPILDEDLNHIENGLKEATDAIIDEQTARTNADNAINASLERHGTRLNNLEHYTIKVDSEGYIAVEYKG